MKTIAMLLIASIALLSACGNAEDPKANKKVPAKHSSHDEHGPHGGELIELGQHEAHLEVVHDDAAGTITLYALDANLKPIALAKGPVLNFNASSGPKQLVATAVRGSSTEWIFSDPSLRDEPEGARLVVVLNGITYTPELPHGHDHDHK
jgi:hypothetical protein